MTKNDKILVAHAIACLATDEFSETYTEEQKKNKREYLKQFVDEGGWDVGMDILSAAVYGDRKKRAVYLKKIAALPKGKFKPLEC